MSTSIASSGETLLAPLHSQTHPPVELNEQTRRTARVQSRVAPPGDDSVKLSVSAQVRQLVQQGQSVNQIANTLGLTESLVNTYLYVPLPGISASASSSSPVINAAL